MSTICPRAESNLATAASRSLRAPVALPTRAFALAIADSWMRESGSHGLAQAEAEYKDFILFYPTMEESAEAQEKICTIHLRQMEKPDRDNKHAFRAEDECRQLLVQWPNSKFAPRVQQLLRNIQEVEAEGEMRSARFYFAKGSNPAAANSSSR